MDDRQRLRQMQACHVQYKRLQAEGVLDDEVTIYRYAECVTGREVLSLKELSNVELNALRDCLQGKPSKVRDKLADAAEKAGILDLTAWMRGAARKGSMRFLRGYTPDTLPVRRAWRLVKILETRTKLREGAA